MAISDVHQSYLMNHGITESVITGCDIRSNGDEIVFPWQDGETVTEQRRPWPGKNGQYYWEKDKDLHFWNLRDNGPDSPVLLCEGTKQSLAVLSWAPDEYSILGMASCWGWTDCDLSRFRGRDVSVILDADAESNLDVYTAGESFADKVEFYTRAVRFVRLPGHGTQGVDDVLAKIPADDRTAYLSYLLTDRLGDKPAKKKPTKRKKDLRAPELDTGGRPLIVVNTDRYRVITDITRALQDRINGKTLFNYGGVLTSVRGHRTVPLDGNAFKHMLAANTYCHKFYPSDGTKPESIVEDWPDPNTIGAVMSQADDYAPLQRITQAPYPRPDGSLVTDEGYDEGTQTVMRMDGLDLPSIPDEPTQQDAVNAAKLLMDGWVGEMPFKSDADRANALALVLTPFLRHLVATVPLAVVSGTEPGIGKSKFLDCVHLMATGQHADMAAITPNDEEMRKQITSHLASGRQWIIFDEAHTIESHQLARALTANSFSDRILGATRMANFPNTATWVAAGNQVEINGDMSRRAYHIVFHPPEANRRDRDAATFQHPEIERWTLENRGQLVAAALTMIRAWYVAGKPRYSRGWTMGSFETWDQYLSGILAYAGWPQFLTDVRERRSEGDYQYSYWEAHVSWLAETFGDGHFMAADVRDKALDDIHAYEAPPGMDNPADKGYTRSLGQQYAKHKDRRYGTYRLVKAGLGHKTRVKWRVVTEGDAMDGTDGSSLPPCDEEKVSAGDTHASSTRVKEAVGGTHPDTSDPSVDEVTTGPEAVVEAAPRVHPIAFDLETASVTDLWRWEGDGYVRLAAVATQGAQDARPDIAAAVDVARRSPTIYTHSGFQFDIPALVHHGHAPDYWELADKAVCVESLARLVDPPPAKEKRSASDKRYDLNTLGEKYLGAGKSHDLKALAKQHGGYDKIPLDDPDYNEYARVDARRTFDIGEKLFTELKRTGRLDYAVREQKIMAVAGHMTLTGLRVDTELLQSRLDDQAQQREKLLDELSSRFGIPTQGQSPLASRAGKDALIAAFAAVGAPYYPKTGKTGDISTSADSMREMVDKYTAMPAERLTSMGTDLDALSRICELVTAVTSQRTIYGTVNTHLTGDTVHPSISMRQASGRWSTTEPGMTVFGKRDGRWREREVILPRRDGELVIAVDLDQVDMRAVAAHSQDHAYMDLFAPGRDVHAEIAEAIFGDRGRRSDAKAIGHGWNYGESINKMVASGVDRAAAEQFDASMRTRFPRLVAWRDGIREQAEAGQLLDNGFGRLMRPDPRRAWTQAPALMGQGCTRDLICEVILRLPREIQSMLMMQVHDEIVLSVPAADADEIGRLVVDAATFEWAPPDAGRTIPITAGLSGPADSWGSLYNV